MSSLHYGGGTCSIEGHVASISIHYQGKLVITSQLPEGYYINNEKNVLIIDTAGIKQELSELFSYIGEFKIISVKAKNIEGDRIDVIVKRLMDYYELLNSKYENLTVKIEDLKTTYTYGRKCLKTRILPLKVVKGNK